MRSARLDALAAQAASVGGRVNLTGDGAFILTHLGRQHQVVNLRALAVIVQQICDRVPECHRALAAVAASRPSAARTDGGART